jgi:hypothetical protein
MSIKKFSEFAMNEDIVPLGFAISSKPSYYTLASSGIRTGYDMQPVVGPVMDLASNLSDQAIDYESNENPDHTARGYINEALKYVKEKCYETYESKCNESLDEAEEVSADKVLTTADKKKLKTAFETVETGIDKLTFKKDGTIEGRRGYFYRHGQSPQSVAEQLKKALSGQGIEITIVDSYDDWKPWPKDSNFVVVFKID